MREWIQIVQDQTVPFKLQLNLSFSWLSLEKSHSRPSALLCDDFYKLKCHFYAVLYFNFQVVFSNSQTTDRRTTNVYIYAFSKILVNSTKIKLNILLHSPQGALFENDYWNSSVSLRTNFNRNWAELSIHCNIKWLVILLSEAPVTVMERKPQTRTLSLTCAVIYNSDVFWVW